VVLLQRHPRHHDLGSQTLRLDSLGDGRTSNQKHEAVRRWLTVDLAVMSRSERPSNLLEHTVSYGRP
jgi:hypothetical protein